MDKYFVCCEDCFQTLAKMNTKAARLWMDLCALRMATAPIFRISYIEYPELRSLETQGFVVSTENHEGITIRVEGYMQTTTGEDFFCVRGGCHD